MRRTRRLTALALGAVATVAMAACGGPSTTGSGSGGGAGQAVGQRSCPEGQRLPLSLHEIRQSVPSRIVGEQLDPRRRLLREDGGRRQRHGRQPHPGGASLSAMQRNAEPGHRVEAAPFARTRR